LEPNSLIDDHYGADTTVLEWHERLVCSEVPIGCPCSEEVG